MDERLQQKHVLGTWLEESFASGTPRSINDAIHYCSIHIDGFTDKKIRSQRAWVSRAIRSLDLDNFIMRNSKSINHIKKTRQLTDIEMEVSEILIHMHHYPNMKLYQDQSNYINISQENQFYPTTERIHFNPFQRNRNNEMTNW